MGLMMKMGLMMTDFFLEVGGTTAFRPGNHALCRSCPLVTPYYCRLGACCVIVVRCICLLFCVCMHTCNFCFLSDFGGCFPLQLSPSVL